MHKRYGGVHALRGAAPRRLSRGEVHVLVGENGSGKSTLLKILSGQVQPDSGEITLAAASRCTSATRRRRCGSGIATVTQETTLAPDLSIAENVFLGHRHGRAPRL